MSSEKATAIVLRTVEFSETSSVVTLFTREFGKISALAKGARRAKSPFESALDLLSICRVVFLRKTSDALCLLTEAKLERRFRPAPGDLVTLYSAYYIAELLGELADADDPHPELFDSAVATLNQLQTQGDVARSVLLFELSTLRLLGHLPAFERCAECDQPVTQKSRIPFALLDGGVMCEKCRAGKRHVVSVSRDAIQVLLKFADSESNEWQAMQLEDQSLGELRGLLNRYLSHLVGHPFKLHRYLGTLS